MERMREWIKINWFTLKPKQSQIIHHEDIQVVQAIVDRLLVDICAN